MDTTYGSDHHQTTVPESRNPENRNNRHHNNFHPANHQQNFPHHSGNNQHHSRSSQFRVDKYPKIVSSSNLENIRRWVMMGIDEMDESILSYIRPFIISNELYCFIGYCIPDEIYRQEYHLIPKPNRLINRSYRPKYPRQNYFPHGCYYPNDIVFHDLAKDDEAETLLNPIKGTPTPSLIVTSNMPAWIAPMALKKDTEQIFIENEITKKFWFFKHDNLIPINAGDGMGMYMHMNLSKTWTAHFDIEPNHHINHTHHKYRN
uniref:CAP10 domain-containing protein n=1 Tax=Rhabditophanes sp. KR3021 TaxID=114890 RepID=A0AC35U0J4_9BILA